MPHLDASIRHSRHGIIEVSDGSLVQVRQRRWPKLISWPEVWLLGEWRHQRRREDRCRLFYSQPRRFPGFLALQYIETGCGTSLATVHLALRTLDDIARLKRSDALLCDVCNARISDRFMRRYGWESHCPSRWHRHYIKRFYGNYPAPREHEAAAKPAELVNS